MAEIKKISNINNLVPSGIINGNFEVLSNAVGKFCTCSTASATAEKAITLNGFSLSTGATIIVSFTNANTATAPTLNVNSVGAISIASESGTVCSSTNPAYFPANSTVEFIYNGTNWVFKKRVIENYVNGGTWYRVYSDGWIEQGGYLATPTAPSAANQTITFPKSFRNTNFTFLTTPINSTELGTYYFTEKPAIRTISSTIVTYTTARSWGARGY